MYVRYAFLRDESSDGSFWKRDVISVPAGGAMSRRERSSDPIDRCKLVRIGQMVLDKQQLVRILSCSGSNARRHHATIWKIADPIWILISQIVKLESRSPENVQLYSLRVVALYSLRVHSGSSAGQKLYIL